MRYVRAGVALTSAWRWLVLVRPRLHVAGRAFLRRCRRVIRSPIAGSRHRALDGRAVGVRKRWNGAKSRERAPTLSAISPPTAHGCSTED
jgi:hypothetical protein